MDSLKSIVVVAILLGVLYGIYQVINDDDSPISPDATNLMAEFDKDGDATEESDADGKSKKSVLKDETPLPVENKLLTDVNPPPSSVDPNKTGFLYPDRNRSDDQKSLVTTAAPKNVRPQNAPRKDSQAKGQSSFTPLQSDPTLQTSNASSVGEMSKVNQGIYRPNESFDPQPTELDRTRNIQTNAESSVKNRFVTGSFAEFEKQVLGDMELAESLIKKNNFRGALKLLSKFYDDPRLTREENQNLVSWLDPLAGKVIYSVEHHLLEPYYVRQNDTLNLLSVKFGVPAELILNINRVSIPDPNNLVPGTELKMVKGPFNVEISLTKKRMTLFVQEMYAGTFSLRVGNEPIPKLGTYRVLSKSRLGQDYSDSNFQRIDALSPNNPYGKYYLNIGGGMAIHGSAQVSDSNDRRGCISLNAVDAEDVHNILTTESTVTIVK